MSRASRLERTRRLQRIRREVRPYRDLLPGLVVVVPGGMFLLTPNDGRPPLHYVNRSARRLILRWQATSAGGLHVAWRQHEAPARAGVLNF